MSIRLYNTLSGQKEEFKPLAPGKVGMYVCGVTTYDYCHIGHARAGIVFDIIYRYFQHAGFDVTYVRNYTDVDDKIINRANERGISSRELAEEFIQAFDEDMAALGVKEATHQPKATEHIDDIITIVNKLIEKDFAYASGGDVYFAVEKYDEYLKLSKRNLEEMQAGARITPGDLKNNPMDFALWKAAKPGEPAWDSPWGPGRPGWHIECSAMSTHFLGETFDIHGGGKDLVFPHHENEIAQSECAHGKTFVNYWVHNGFVNVDSEKMSKSLGNFFTIREILKKYDAEVVRFFILTAHYRSPIDFSDKNLEDAKAGLSRLYEGIKAANEVLADGGTGHATPTEEQAELLAKLAAMPKQFKAAMDDDFNSALAIANFFDAIRGLNRIVAEGWAAESKVVFDGLQQAVGTLKQLAGEVLGVLQSEPTEWLEKQKTDALGETDLNPEAIEALIEERKQAKKNKDFARADAIRAELDSKGIVLLDSREGTTWKAK